MQVGNALAQAVERGEIGAGDVGQDGRRGGLEQSQRPCRGDFRGSAVRDRSRVEEMVESAADHITP